MALFHRLLLCTVLATIAGAAQAATYTIAIEPTYPPEQAREVYKPLLDYLGKSTGHTFNLVAPRNYHFHWRDIRNNAKVDFTFEEAHFVDYRARRNGFVPLARLAEPSSYTLLASTEHADRGMDGLVGYRVVCMPSPSLGFALLAEMFKNPLAQADIRSEASSWRDGVEMVFSGEAEGAMVPTFLAQQYPNLVAVQTSREFPGAAVSASPDVPEDVREAVKTALLAMHEDAGLYTVLTDIGATRFEPASIEDYRGSEAMLKAFFGYSAN